MHIQKITFLLTALALIPLGAAAQAGPQTMTQATTVKMAAPEAAVIVKFGTAMLEEYHGGDPAQRTTFFRDGESAQTPMTPKVKPQS